MSEVDLTQQLDQAIDTMMATGEMPASVDARIGDLLAIAVELRDLPRAEFKARLQDELEEEAAVNAATKQATKEVNPVRQGFRTVTPYLVVPDVHAEVEFLTRALGAEGHVFGLGTQGGFHGEYKIGESTIMVGGGGEGSAWKGNAFPGSIHLYVEDVDVLYRRALQAGATSLYAPMDQPYGDRDCGVQDVGGNQWFLGTRLGGGSVPEGAHNLMPCLHPKGAPRMIEFLKQAFGAEEGLVHRSPDGVVHFARMRIGDAVIEMGEAHDQWQPKPSVFMMYVDDVDAWYERATKAEGAVAKDAPKMQPYGARVGSITDPFDNVWYIASQVTMADAESTESERKLMGAPKMFRIALQVADLEQAAAFYTKLLNDPGIPIPRGSRHYFDCGGITLALVDVAKGGEKPQPTPDYIYFAVNNLKEVYERAKALNCLAQDRYHDQEAGEIVKRPWGEVSFYVEDPWGNGLCFVDETTLFTGK
ncbi:MAG TPA: VOC family protein [Pyrinomonadaceae bacterium]|nr:VOC family protein [Pyrinomonadaceae bacterium]